MLFKDYVRCTLSRYGDISVEIDGVFCKLDPFRTTTKDADFYLINPSGKSIPVTYDKIKDLKVDASMALLPVLRSTIRKKGLKRNLGKEVLLSSGDKRTTGILNADGECFYVGSRRHRVRQDDVIGQHISGTDQKRFYDVDLD